MFECVKFNSEVWVKKGEGVLQNLKTLRVVKGEGVKVSPKYEDSELYNYLKTHTQFDDFNVDVVRLQVGEYVLKNYIKYNIFVKKELQGLCRIVITNHNNSELLFNAYVDSVNKFKAID